MFRLLCVLVILSLSAPASAAGPLDGAVIVVDPGHGGQNYSKSYTGGTRGVASKLTESELNLSVALELEKLLKEAGATVTLTRRADHRLSSEGSTNKQELHARIDFFEHDNPHFFLSVHHNASDTRAGGATATGHTTLYKNNAKDDTLYEALAKDVNDALESQVPGPKLKLIRGDYHILRETDIPGTISESGFMTNKEFDELCNRPEYPKQEAEAICKGAVKYWKDHKPALIALRERLSKERATHPRDPNTYTANALNPAYQKKMKDLLAKIEPSGKFDSSKLNPYLEAFRQQLPPERRDKFKLKAEWDGKRLKLSGEADKPDWNGAVDMLVAVLFR